MFGESANKVAPKVGNSTTTRGRRKPILPIILGVGIRQTIKNEAIEF